MRHSTLQLLESSNSLALGYMDQLAASVTAISCAQADDMHNEYEW